MARRQPVVISLLVALLLTAQDIETVGTEWRERVPQSTVVPTYPEKARRARLEGQVEVCFHVNRKGKPYRIAVRSSSHRLFEKPAIRAVRESRYVPLEPSDPVPAIKTCRTFQFNLTPLSVSDEPT